ncbi:diacylglycerol/lipid kinase family protein [Ramlibacter sp.]|uniref:diacylglycerol/lipid kinase family protein n=1 Tax=Ramlibacter sp. TaxID=1917967 RepID=UPI003D0FB62E
MFAVPESPATAPEPELFIVMNRSSGAHAKDDVRDAIESELKSAGRRYRFVPVEPGQIVRSCQEAAREAAGCGGAIVAVGGDGTLNAAARAALLHNCAIGVIAQGTFNLFAREHGLPLEAAAAARALLDAAPEDVQVGLVNQHAFLVNASVGLYPKLLADREAVKQKLGRRRWIAMGAALMSVFEWRLRLDLEAEVDGVQRRFRTPSIFVCNNRLQVERVGLDAPVQERTGRGWLAAVVVRSIGVVGKIKLMFRTAVGTLGDAREVDDFAMKSLTVTARHARKLRVATDGEVQWMALPLRFTVSPKPLRVLLPPVDRREPRQ